MTTQISNSEMRTWKRCRRKWWFVYYRELGTKRPAVTGALAFGTRVHQTMERHYAGEDALAWVKQSYADELAERVSDPYFLEEDEKKLNKEWDMAAIMVENFITWAQETGLDTNYVVEAAEEVIEVPSSREGISLRAKLDQRVLRVSDGAVLFRDFKTAADFSGVKFLAQDEQMLFYQLLLTIAHPDKRIDGALYLMLKKSMQTPRAAPPFYKEGTAHHNRAELESMWLRVCKVVDEIADTMLNLDAGADHRYECPPNPTRDCGWDCPFFQVCTLADDGSDLEGALSEYYEHLDPHERYDEKETEVA